MPPQLLLPSLSILDRNTSKATAEVKAEIQALQPATPLRTLVNAYVMPSLTDLGLYEGSLRYGTLTRYARDVVGAYKSGHIAIATELIARQLIQIDSRKVHFVNWLIEHQDSTKVPRQDQIKSFVAETAAKAGLPQTQAKIVRDRVGKWVGYLLYFHVIREQPLLRGRTLSAEKRHIDALESSHEFQISDADLREIALEAYGRLVRQFGTRLYIPVANLRDEIGLRLRKQGVLLTDAEIDEILRRLPKILATHVVTFSPFSGPASGGVVVEGTYAGFISVRPRELVS
jgi:hypothetical protein